MKKVVIILTAIILSFGIMPAKAEIAFAESHSYYAKVIGTGVELCSETDESTGMFEIPYSYFVLVEEGRDDYFKVSYNGVSGYVKKEYVTLMSGTPEKPYYSMDTYAVIPYYLYDAPNTSSFSASIDESVTLHFIGRKSGQWVTHDSNEWYYCSAAVEGLTFYGYVYSAFCFYKRPERIPENSEYFDEIPEEMLFPSTNQFEGLSLWTKILLVVAITVPSALILYFLIKPSRIMKLSKGKQRSAVKKPQKRVRHGDYFEFDESEL